MSFSVARLSRVIVLTILFHAFSNVGLLYAENGALIVSPNGELPLRDSPPGFFSGKGEQIGVIRPGQEYIVLEKKTVPSIFGNEEWLRIQALPGTDGGQSGWTFSGTGGSTGNFRQLER